MTSDNDQTALTDRANLPLLRRFSGLILGTMFLGLLLALIGDRPGVDDSYYFDNAARDVGAALVSGGIIAALVVWFEDRREEQRVEREYGRDERRFRREQEREDIRQELEEQRSDVAALRAWRRELEFRLLNFVYADLWRGRMARLRERRSTPGLTRSEIDPEFYYRIGETKHMLKVLQDDELLESWLYYELVERSDPINPEVTATLAPRAVEEWNQNWLDAESRSYFTFRDLVQTRIIEKYTARD